MRPLAFPLCATALALLLADHAAARDYGQQGAVWPVIEPDLLQQIHARLTRLEASGETARLNEELKRRTIARVNRPEPVADVSAATLVRRWRFDPTITAPRDIADDKGRVIIAAGTRVNPLDTVPLRAPLVFLDGDDPRQLGWALRRYGPDKAKLILVRGAPLELMKARQRRFYFDQGGSLVKHFGIRAVPATVEQQGRVLLVTEQPARAGEGAPS
ncbi:type-F conjugative transfer system protein TraW [Novosphingobium piscinae]|uniref:Type-F conjugative transfer system protein TraW n=1 Tax=Novosphingobium piscinae TaxID=1507448 RepID=A0A7X1KP21_9SPHN|nr:type-F conjugative transfer system protein TraW [Novosphingobium piscinae]